jgi:hypothetical protein
VTAVAAAKAALFKRLGGETGVSRPVGCFYDLMAL